MLLLFFYLLEGHLVSRNSFSPLRYSGHDQPPTQRQAPRSGSRPASGVDRVSSSQVRPTDRTPTPDRTSTRQSRQRDEGSSSIAGSRLLSSDEKPDLREVDVSVLFISVTMNAI